MRSLFDRDNTLDAGVAGALVRGEAPPEGWEQAIKRMIRLNGLTLKPEEDTVDVLRHHRSMYGAGPGWTFLTAKPDDMERLRRALGFTYPDPAIDKDKTQHIGNIRYGNEPLMFWSACPGMAHAKWIAETLEWMVHPEQNRVQPS